jgi:hypothetical protein
MVWDGMAKRNNAWQLSARQGALPIFRSGRLFSAPLANERTQTTRNVFGFNEDPGLKSFGAIQRLWYCKPVDITGVPGGAAITRFFAGERACTEKTDA